MAFSKSARREKIRKRVRRTVTGTSSRPRLSVFRSNKEIYAQLINDVDGVTIAAASSRELDSNSPKKDVAKEVGKAVAEKAKAAGIEAVSFDRGGYLYHGRVLSLAEGAREAGLKF
ncbi:50S ribosomal protein L18 [Nonlabens xiamenensis]|uniref:50S ribosomal protein L18 n=1 Tax=Nonlabens xiamenensis TaxID=2341043 RepID=UPI000F614F19|nr:50S ribosomal protein L18 [Nonlabens xiamenensis]